ncbi:MAG TPA: OmpA family protein [Saprospiraceae bacterium]|nr:OmpA family protein [Saprospiraceae bacterium]
MTKKLLTLVLGAILISSCVSKKKFNEMQTNLQEQNAKLTADITKCGEDLSAQLRATKACEDDKALLKSQLEGTIKLRDEKIVTLEQLVTEYRTQYNNQIQQVGNLTVLSQQANQNIGETLKQLEAKDKYISLLQAAKTKADSINLALAVNLKGVLSDGIADQDVEIAIDKTVVMINLSDKMLFTSGSYNLSSKANNVLEKIAKIVASRPDVEVLVEGYTDNVPIKNSCIDDNWDLSVKRSATVVRALQNKHGIDPNKLIAAGRGQYNTLAENTTAEGRSKNRRTRIIIMPKLDQFYDLLNPDKATVKLD